MVRRIRKPLKTVREVAGPERIIYRDRPVEVVKEVEKVVYRDHPAAAMLSELEATKAKLDERDVHEEPPASIADLFQPDKPLAPQAAALQELWVQLGHQIQRGEATVDQIRKHERLSSELEFINKHAFDGI